MALNGYSWWDEADGMGGSWVDGGEREIESKTVVYINLQDTPHGSHLA